MHTKENWVLFLPHGVHCLLVYIVCFPRYLFLHFFLTYLVHYLSFRIRIDPLRFQARCRKKRLNRAVVFLCLFCVVVHFWKLYLLSRTSTAIIKLNFAFGLVQSRTNSSHLLYSVDRRRILFYAKKKNAVLKILAMFQWGSVSAVRCFYYVFIVCVREC